MGMGRPESNNRRIAALAMVVGVASNPMPMSGPTFETNIPVVRTETSAPVVPQRAPTPIREEKRANDLGQRFRGEILKASADNYQPSQSKTRGGKFAVTNEMDYGSNDAAFSQRQNHARSPRGKTEVFPKEKEQQSSSSNDLRDLVLQELDSTPGTYSLGENQLRLKVRTAIEAVLNPWYVKKDVRAEIDEQDSLDNNDSAETPYKAANTKSNPEKLTKGKIEFNPVPEATGGKCKPLSPQEEEKLIKHMVSHFVEGTHFKINKDSKVRLTMDGAFVVDDFLKPFFKEKNLSYADFKLNEFVEANLEAFRLKGSAIRVRKFINAQLAQALKGRDKTRSKQRREKNRTSVVANFTEEYDDTNYDTEAPEDEPMQDYAVNNSPDYHGFDPEAENAKAEAYLASIKAEYEALRKFASDEEEDLDLHPKTGRRATRRTIKQFI